MNEKKQLDWRENEKNTKPTSFRMVRMDATTTAQMGNKSYSE